MADTFTPFLNLTKPDIGGDTDTWGQLLNNDMDLIDAGVKAASNSATAANTAATAAQSTANTAFATASSFGQCRFVFVSSTQCRLNRYNGQYVIINGTPQSIPSAGVNLSNSGLTAGNLYYVYVYMNGTTMTLEASTTGHSTDPNGIEIKTGDATRTLVGMVYIGTGAIFRDDPTADIHVASYFNRRPRRVQNLVVNGGVVTSGSLTLIGSGLSMVAWKDEAVSSKAPADMSNTTSAQWVRIFNVWNGAGTGVGGYYQAFSGNAIGSVTAYSTCDTLTQGGIAPSEGLIGFRVGFTVSGGQGNISNAAIYAETNA